MKETSFNVSLLSYRFGKKFLLGYVDLQINEFVKLGGDQLIPYYADILGAILPCISDKEEKIRVVCMVLSFMFDHLKIILNVFFLIHS